MSSPPRERSCLVCRKRTQQDGMLRLAWNGNLVIDKDCKLIGRGAYIHADCKGRLKPEQVRRALRLKEVPCLSGL